MCHLGVREHSLLTRSWHEYTGDRISWCTRNCQNICLHLRWRKKSGMKTKSQSLLLICLLFTLTFTSPALSHISHVWVFRYFWSFFEESLLRHTNILIKFTTAQQKYLPTDFSIQKFFAFCLCAIPPNEAYFMLQPLPPPPTHAKSGATYPHPLPLFRTQR